jgi:molybdate transport system substrate-binding protein
MNKQLRASIRVALAITAVLTLPAAATGQVKVIISGGFSAAYRELLPEFEKSTAIKVTTTSGGSVGSGPNTIGAQVRRGVPADVVILAREGLSELIAEGRIVPGTDTDLARSIIGLAVRTGAAKPDISTIEGLKQTLLRAKSVAVSSSTSGVYLTTKLYPKLGIADEMAKKTVTSGVAAVARGEAEIGLQQVSEILPVAGIELVAAIPAEIQYVTIYAAGVVAGSKEIDASRRLIAFLASANAMPAIKKSGMEPARAR